MRKYILFSFLFFFIAACSNDEQPGKSSDSVNTTPQATASVAAPTTANYQSAAFKLVFFLDPDGGPCRLQNSILKDMANELRGKVDIQYVQTTVPADRDIFYQYGIRALPTLLLADASGKEIRRMPPGVKRDTDIRLLIQSIPQS